MTQTHKDSRANKQSRRQQILSALAEMLETSRFDRITTARLAGHLQVSEAALYRHFPSKAKMYEALLEFSEDAIFSRVHTILEEEPGAEARCYGILTLLLGFCERNPGISRLLAGNALAGEKQQLHLRASQLLERAETQLKQVLREAEIKENKRTRLTISEAAEMMLAIAEGKISQFVRSGFDRKPTNRWPQQWREYSKELFY